MGEFVKFRGWKMGARYQFDGFDFIFVHDDSGDGSEEIFLNWY